MRYIFSTEKRNFYAFILPPSNACIHRLRNYRNDFINFCDVFVVEQYESYTDHSVQHTKIEHTDCLKKASLVRSINDKS
jgi:hypothetical protein